MAGSTTRETFQIDSEAQLAALNDTLDALREHSEALSEIGDSSAEASEGGGRLSGVMSSLKGVATTAVVGLSAVAAVGGAVVTGVGIAVKAFNDMNDAMADVEAQTGITGDELDALEDTVRAVYQQGLVESVAEAAAAMTDVQRQLGLTGDALTDATNRAVVLSEVFDKDINESTRAVKQMRVAFDELGDGDAFDLITAAIQRTGDPADDILDTFSEYSPIMAQAGFSAAEFTSLLTSGLEAGAFNADKVADAVKEFNVRLLDGSDASAEALGALVDDTDAFLGALSDGSMSGADALAIVTEKLAGIDDPMQRAQIGVALFGSMYEDLGETVILSLDPAVTALEDVAGATDRAGKVLDDKLSTKWTKFTRTVTMSLGQAIEPFAGALLDTLTPALEGATEWVGENLPDAIEWLTDALAPLQEAVVALFGSDTTELLETLHATLIGVFGEETAGQIIAFVEQVAGAISSALGGALDWVTENWPRIQETVVNGLLLLYELAQPILDEIGAFFMQTLGQVVDWVTENWPLIQSTITIALGVTKAVIETELAAIASFWEAHGAKLMALVSTTWTTLQTVISSLITIIGEIIRAVMFAIHGDWAAAWSAIEAAGLAAWTALKSIISTSIEFIKVLISIGMDAITIVISTAWTIIKTAAGLAWDGIVFLVNTGLKTLRTIIDFAWTAIQTAATTAWTNIKTAVAAGVTAMVATLTGIVGSVKEAGKAIVQAVKDGIDEAWAGLVDWFGDKLSDLTDMLPFSPPKDPRSRLHRLPEGGRGIVNTLLAGVDEALPALQSRLASLTVPPPQAGLLHAAGAGLVRQAVRLAPSAAAQGFTPSATSRPTIGFANYGELHLHLPDVTDGDSLLQALEELAA